MGKDCDVEYPEGVQRRGRASARLLKEGERWLEPPAVSQLLTCYGIDAADSRSAKGARQAARAAAEIGGQWR